MTFVWMLPSPAWPKQATGKPCFFRSIAANLNKALQLSARHDDVLVQFREAGVAERVGKFAADLPDGFAFLVAKTALDEQRFLFADNLFHGGDFLAHGIFLSVQFQNQMRLAAEQAFALGAFGGGGKREFIRQLGGAGQKAGGKNRLQRADGGVHRIEADGEVRAERRERNQFQRRLGDDAEQAFRADEQPVQIEAGLVFVRAAAESDDRAVGQHDFQAEDVIAGDAVFEAARAAGVGGDVAADEIVRAAGGVGRIKQAAPLARRPGIPRC